MDLERRITSRLIQAGTQATVSQLAEIRLRPDGHLTGYAIVWDALSLDLGGFVERVSRGAVELDADVLATYNHRLDQLLGRTASGTLSVTLDDTGLAYDVTLPDTGAGRDVRELVRRGDVVGSSFTFATMDQKWTKVAGTDTQLRTLTKIRVSEVGPVTAPAYPDTSVATRSMTLAGASEQAAAAAAAMLENQRRRTEGLLWRLED